MHIMFIVLLIGYNLPSLLHQEKLFQFINSFSKLTFIVNIVCSSSKRHDELQAAKLDEIAYLLEIDELENGKGVNQIGTIKRVGDTRWSSHFSSICRLMNMYDATCLVLEKNNVDGSTYS